jgi:ADP-heptose:LPS heptosyltransferase
MKNKIYIKSWGGIGDVILTTPVFKEVKQQLPGYKVVVVCNSKRDMEVYENNPHIDSIVYSNSFIGRLIALYERMGKVKIYNMDYGRLFPSILYSQKAAQIIADILEIKLTDTKLQLFTTEKEEAKAKEILNKYKRPVLIHITSNCSSNQMWPIINWEELIKTTPEFTFIQLGLTNETRIQGAIDLRGKTTLRDAFSLMKHAHGFVGVVSFLSHVTNAFDTKGVVLFGPSSVSVWGHDNNINISKNLPCAPCIDTLHKHDCPFDKPCLRTISVQEVKDALYKQTLMM